MSSEIKQNQFNPEFNAESKIDSIEQTITGLSGHSWIKKSDVISIEQTISNIAQEVLSGHYVVINKASLTKKIEALSEKISNLSPKSKGVQACINRFFIQKAKKALCSQTANLLTTVSGLQEMSIAKALCEEGRGQVAEIGSEGWINGTLGNATLTV